MLLTNKPTIKQTNPAKNRTSSLAEAKNMKVKTKAFHVVYSFLIFGIELFISSEISSSCTSANFYTLLKSEHGCDVVDT